MSAGMSVKVQRKDGGVVWFNSDYVIAISATPPAGGTETKAELHVELKGSVPRLFFFDTLEEAINAINQEDQT